MHTKDRGFQVDVMKINCSELRSECLLWYIQQVKKTKVVVLCGGHLTQLLPFLIKLTPHSVEEEIH